jgi:hypothetical protein
MKARPILMHARSIQNLLAGRKSQTRRIVKPQPKRRWLAEMFDGCALFSRPGTLAGEFTQAVKCPYGLVGDLLWVRETFAPNRVLPMSHREPGEFIYRADRDPEDGGVKWSANWKPSIHMPRRASRLTLQLTYVRVERVQDISDWDAYAEGIKDGDAPASTPCQQFERLWNNTNGPGAWKRNDWTWALSFEVLRKNVDAVLAQ